MRSTDSFKQRRLRGWIGCFTLLVGLPPLLYFGYCWGLWGRSSLLLQHYFQCKCPPASEQTRIPKEAELLFSACHPATVGLSPSGRFLLVREGPSRNITYLLNLETAQRTPIPAVTSLLTDEIAFTQEGGDAILELFTGNRYPIQTFRYWQTDAYINNKPNLDLLADTLRKAHEIYLTENLGTTIVLMSEFPTHMEQNFTFDDLDLPGVDSEQVEQFLILNNIEYTALPKRFPEEVVSPDKRFIARDDGIYLAETNQKIVQGARRLSVRGWVSDGSGAIYTSYGQPCLLWLAIPMGDDPWCEIRVPQPVLKLKVPEEYR